MLSAAAMIVFLPWASPADDVPSETDLLRPEVFTLEEEEDAKKDGKWHGSVTAGVTVNSGNTNSTVITATAETVRRTAQDRTTLAASYLFSENEVDDGTGTGDTTDEISQRSTILRGQYDRFLSERAYAYANASWMDDYANDLIHRYTVGAGGGYQFIDDEMLQLSGELGPGYYVEEYKGGDEDEFVSARGAENVAWQASETVKLTNRTEVFQSLEDLEDTFLTVDSAANVNLTASMLLRLQWIVFYDTTPASGNDRVDNRYVLTVGWGF